LQNKIGIATPKVPNVKIKQLAHAALKQKAARSGQSA
jgi:hypothetical protein